MLNSISWSHFFIVIGMLTTAYYAVTVLLLFSHEIKSLLKGKSQSDSFSSQSKVNPHENLLGNTRPEQKRVPREGYVSSDSLNIIRSESPDDPIDSSHEEELLTGSVADLLEEVKTKLSAMPDWNKDEVFGALRELLAKATQLRETAYRESINYFITSRCTDHFNWSVEPEEIDKLW